MPTRSARSCASVSRPRSRAAAAACGTGTSRAAASTGRDSMFEMLGYEPARRASRLRRGQPPHPSRRRRPLRPGRQLAEPRRATTVDHVFRIRARRRATGSGCGPAPNWSRPARPRSAPDRHRHRHHRADAAWSSAPTTADMRLRDAIETISEAFVLWDAENRLVMCNSKFQELHNLPGRRRHAGHALRGASRARR